MPKPLDDNEQELTPSTSSDTLDDATAPKPDDGDGRAVADGADSSDAQGDNDAQPDTRSIVRDVVAQRSQAAAASPAEGQDDGSNPGGTGSDKTPKEPDDENYSDVPFHKHPRFQHLLRKAKSNETDAVRYRNVQGFLDDNGIDAEEAAEGFTIMAAMKKDPVKAWELLKPHVQQLLIAAGEVLPDDLGKRVQSGELTREAAQEIARANARAQSVETGRTFEQQRAERQRQQEHAQSLYETAAAWERDRQEKDPNFAAKQQLLLEKLAYLQMTEGKPNTPEGVKAQLDKAYKAIVLPTSAQRPGPKPPTVGERVPPKPPVSSRASGNLQPAPKSTLDIVNSVIAKRKAG